MKYEVIDEDVAYERYDESMDCEGEVDVAGTSFLPSKIIKEMDPTMYRCGFVDYCDYLRRDGIFIEGIDEEGRDYFICQECDEIFDNEEDMKECCSEDDEE